MDMQTDLTLLRLSIRNDALYAMLAALITPDGQINPAEDASRVNWIKLEDMRKLNGNSFETPVIREYDDGGHFSVLQERIITVTRTIAVYIMRVMGDTGNIWITAMAIDYENLELPTARRVWFMADGHDKRSIETCVEPESFIFPNWGITNETPVVHTI